MTLQSSGSIVDSNGKQEVTDIAYAVSLLGWAFHLDPSTMPLTIGGLTPLEPVHVAWMLLLQPLICCCCNPVIEGLGESGCTETKREGGFWKGEPQ